MATGNATRLQRAAEREARLQDQLVLEFEGDLEGVLRRTDRLIARLVRALDQEDGRLVRTRASLGRAVRMRQDLHRAFDQAGFHALADRAVHGRFEVLSDTVLAHESIAARAADLTRVDVQALTAFRELRLAELLDWSQAVSRQTWRITVDGVLGLAPVDDLVENLGGVLDTSVPRARTIYDTAVSTYSRQAGLLHATGEASELFYYAGPMDRITRPFCRDRVGKVYSREQIDAMDNGQIPDALVTGGGYNCRHAFKRVSMLDSELKDLHESGDRLPHVQDRLNALKAA